MRVNLNLLIVAGLGVSAYVLWKKGKAKLDPTSDKNIFYESANSIAQALGMDPSKSIGTALSDLIRGVPDAGGAPPKIRPVKKPRAPVTYDGYPGGVNYPAAPSAPVGFKDNPFIPDYLKNM